MTETNTSNKKKTGKIILGVAIFAVLVGVFVAVYMHFGPKAQAGAKFVTIEVVDDTQTSTTYEVHTDAEYLKQVMDRADGLEYSGTDSEYGMMIDTVNGVKADYAVNGAYWSFYVNDEYCNYGVESQPVADGDAFKIEYTVAVTE